MWSLNLNTIKNNLQHLRDFSIDNFNLFEKKVLCIYGERSNYLNKKNERIFKSFFPNTNFLLMKNAGHWLHVENPNYFIKTISQYLI